MGDFVKTTQDTLGKLIKKPPLTEKLLRKPPFRFLHDIITEVINTTNFMKGLYTATEMDSQNVKDKDSKIAFLQKAIDVVTIVHNKPMSVKPSKIVAGHEPERTNELLQQIARAISNQLDSSEAVAKVLGGSKIDLDSKKPPRPAKEDEKSRDTSGDKRKREKENKEKSSSSDNRDRSSSRDRDKGKDKDLKGRDRSKERDHHRERSKDKDRERERSKERDRERSKDKERSKERTRLDKDRPKDGEKDRDRDRDRDKERTRDKDRDREKDHDREKDRDKVKGREREKDRDRDKERDRERRERRKRKEEEDASRKQQQHLEENGLQEDDEDVRQAPPELEDGASTNRIPRPTSAKGQRRRPTQGSDDSEGEEEIDGSLRQTQHDRDNMVNGGDSLPQQVQASRRMARPSSARPAPPRLKKQESVDDPAMRIGSGKQVTNVIVDNGQNSEDEDDTFVVEETHPVIADGPQVIGSESLEDDGEHGGLVRKILETKKELEGNKAADKKEDKPIVLDAARRKERERVQREVEKLTGSIQTLTRSANPLGKIMDYLQEDVDSMQKELEMWRKENREHQLAIKREQSVTDTELEPLRAQLTELDQSIKDQLDTIATIKANILRGDDKISKMVSSVAIS